MVNAGDGQLQFSLLGALFPHSRPRIRPPADWCADIISNKCSIVNLNGDLAIPSEQKNVSTRLRTGDFSCMIAKA